MIPIPPVSVLDLAFPTSEKLAKSDIPSEFFKSRNVWHRLAEDLFYNRFDARSMRLFRREGVSPSDAEQCWNAIRVSLGVYDVKHEIKIARTAWMLSEWFYDAWIVGEEKTRILSEVITAEFASALEAQR